MKTKWEFDERQMQIRGKVFYRGFIATLSLLLLNASLHSLDIVWASGFQQNILIMALASTITGIGAILRGAYFGRGTSRWLVIVTFGLLSLVLAVLNVLRISQGDTLIENGALTDTGASVALAVMFASLTFVAIAKEINERRQKSE